MSKITIDDTTYTEDEIYDMICEIKELKEQEIEQDEKIELHQADNENLTYKLNLQVERNTALISEMKKMKHKMDQKDIFKEKGIIDKMEFYKKRCDEHEKKIQSLESSNGDSMSQEQKQKICKANKALKLMNENKDIKIKELEEQNENYFLQMNLYKDEIAPLKERCEKSHENNERLRKENTEIWREAQKQKEANKNNIYDNGDTDNIISTLREELAEVKTELKAERKKIKTPPKIDSTKIDTHMLELKEKVLSNVDSLTKECKRLQEENEKLKKDNIVTEKIMENSETQTEVRNNIPEKEIKTPKLDSQEFTKEDICKVFDMIYDKKMSKGKNNINAKVASRLMNKRKDVIDFIVNDKKKKDDKEDYSVDFMKTIITLIKDNNKKEERINKLLDKL